MKVKIQKWGNSNGIRIPNTIMKSLKINTNDLLDLNLEENKIVLTKLKRQSLNLEDEFEKYNAQSNSSSKNILRGGEIW